MALSTTRPIDFAPPDLCAIVVIACHFSGRDTLCKTTTARLEKAIEFVKNACRNRKSWQFFFVVTGDVPYEAGSKTLCELMREYLEARGFAGTGKVIMATGLTGSFAEPGLVCEQLKRLKRKLHNLDQLAVVSSDWQLKTGEPFWRRYAAWAHLQLEFVPIRNTGGWRTRLFYAGYAVFIRLALAVGVWDKIEPFLYRKLYAPRANGFKANGCA